MSLTGFEVYRYYLGIRLHFTSKEYDVIAAGGKTNVGQNAYLKRKDRKLFEYLAKTFSEPREIIKYFIANFAYGHTEVLYDKGHGQEFLDRWIKTKESLSRVFKNDLDKIVNYAEKSRLDLKLFFKSEKDGLSCILKLYRTGEVSPESICLIHQILPGLLSSWESFPENELIYGEDFLRIRKMSSFVVPTPLCLDVWEKFSEEHLK